MFIASPTACHNVTIYAIDAAGNIGLSDIYFTTIFLYRGSPPISPIVSIISPENSSFLKSNVPLTFTVDNTIPLSWIQPIFTNISQTSYSIDGQNEVTVKGNKTLTGLSNGAHNITVYVKDTFGTVGVSQTIYFTTDAEPFPLLTVAAVSAVLAAIVASGILVFWKKCR